MVPREVSTAPTTYPVLADALPPDTLVQGRYRVRFARSLEDLDAILRLRFEVFNLELGEGLDSSYETGRDEDPFDPVCHHLMVEDTEAGPEPYVVGTYRMQTREMASRFRGFYSAGEFDLGALPDDLIAGAVETGRACVARPYRNRHVLFLLWKGLAVYLSRNRKRYLLGCCSLTSQDHAEGIRVLNYLAATGQVHPELRVSPLPGLECQPQAPPACVPGEVHLPVLFRTYLRYGAKVCGPPAVDREFKTIDFLVILDVETLDPDLRHLYF